MVIPSLSWADDLSAGDIYFYEVPVFDGYEVYKVDEDVWSFRSAGSEIMPLDISGNYSVGTANLEIFDRIVDKIALTNDYVYYREGQYNYVLVYGHSLSLVGTVFSSNSPVTVVTYSNYSSGSNSPTFTVTQRSSFSLNVSNYLCYSSLGSYPRLGKEGFYYVLPFACSFGLIVAILLLFWRIVWRRL